jgi:hypothetical protein
MDNDSRAVQEARFKRLLVECPQFPVRKRKIYEGEENVCDDGERNAAE